ncbi:hypothetical protein FHG64_14460 [Antarcticibacterium flavum]|uniref:Uncharacterized protein n=1 Tax=Antarcticibacterium flavum TaxID=2058175 RepID=A0A5B7X543_9FLAO|nr:MULTISPECIES: hypothetical protein [Antarcticibacterium]MCM4161067.1 hypothetical protein [Antarcticibacterium sp. W02-3]QCY70507.1 hypothetical protein FHG64_14460 [Antarcticibacterium flavum]
MFINPLKRAAAKKRILQLLDSREEGNFKGDVNSIGVIIDDKNLNALEELRTLKKSLGIPDDKFTVVIFSAKRKTGKDFDMLDYCLNDIDLKAGIKKPELEKFAVGGVDLLITFAAESNTPVHLLTAYCHAGFKVGRYRQNIPLYDLVIGTEEPSIFKEELLKYLKRIKRT